MSSSFAGWREGLTAVGAFATGGLGNLLLCDSPPRAVWKALEYSLEFAFSFSATTFKRASPLGGGGGGGGEPPPGPTPAGLRLRSLASERWNRAGSLAASICAAIAPAPGAPGGGPPPDVASMVTSGGSSSRFWALWSTTSGRPRMIAACMPCTAARPLACECIASSLRRRCSTSRAST